MKITSFLNMDKLSGKKIETNENTIKTENVADNEFEQLGLKPTKENKKIFDVLKENGVTPTKENIEDIKTAFEGMEGTFDEKIDSLDVLLKKDVEVTVRNVQLVHIALTKEIDYNELFEKLDEFFESDDIDYGKLLNTIGLSEDVIEKIITLLSSTENVQEAFELLVDEKPEILTEEDLKIIEDIFKEESEKTEKLNVDDEFLEKLNEVIKEVINELSEVIPDGNIVLMDTNNFRQFLVETTTEKTIEIEKEFKGFQVEVVKKLSELIETPEQITPKKIENIIKNFEKIIMKSDITLYTSMKDEKNLIKMASDLELAKDEVSSDNLNKAKEILKAIKTELDKIDFKPKNLEMKAFMKNEVDKILFPNKEKQEFNAAYNKFKVPNKGTRATLEVLRSTGINHDVEVVQGIEKNNIENLEMANLKKIIMPILKSDVSESIFKDTLNSATGHQLLNKLEVNSNLQSITLTVPYMMNSKIESLDLYIHSKKESEKIDWKNTTIYFELNLSNYGKTGIKISANNKSLNMDLKNDTDEFKNDTLDIFDEFLEELSEIGYVKGRINYSKFEETSSIKTVQDFTSEGFDIKI